LRFFKNCLTAAQNGNVVFRSCIDEKKNT
jgi:hypothetical protein